MNKPIPTDEELDKVFSDLQPGDPGIKIKNGSIELRPDYLNYSFLISFLMLPILGWLYYSSWLEYEYNMQLLCILLIIVLVFIILYELRPYNKTIINLGDKTVKIIPNIIWAIFIKKKLVPFTDIKKIDYYQTGGLPRYQRSVLRATLFDSTELKLTSTKEEENAQKLVGALFKVIKILPQV